MIECLLVQIDRFERNNAKNTPTIITTTKEINIKSLSIFIFKNDVFYQIIFKINPIKIFFLVSFELKYTKMECLLVVDAQLEFLGPDGVKEDAMNMLKAFGQENSTSNFDWDDTYGKGFHAVDFSTLN